MKLIIGLLIFGIFVYLFRFENKKRQGKIEKAFKNREPLSTNDFYLKYYKEQNIPFSVVNGIKQILEEQLNADFSRLSAKDDFSKNLSFFWDYDSLADVAIVEAIEELFSIKIEDSEAKQMRTVDDLIMTVTQKIKV